MLIYIVFIEVNNFIGYFYGVEVKILVFCYWWVGV